MFEGGAGDYTFAAQACFGADDWPGDVPEPRATVEFEVADLAEVDDAGQTGTIGIAGASALRSW